MRCTRRESTHFDFLATISYLHAAFLAAHTTVYTFLHSARRAPASLSCTHLAVPHEEKNVQIRSRSSFWDRVIMDLTSHVFL